MADVRQLPARVAWGRRAATLTALVTAVLLVGAAVLIPGDARGTAAPAGSPVGVASPGPVAWSTIGNPPVAADGSGYTAAGRQPTGFLARTGERFVAGASGMVADVLLPVRRFGHGGDGGFVLGLHVDDGGRPGVLLGTAIGTAPESRDGDGRPTTAKVTASIPLATGQAYWLVLEPTAGTRLAWAVGPADATGLHLSADAWGDTITTAPQAAFEVRLARP